MALERPVVRLVAQSEPRSTRGLGPNATSACGAFLRAHGLALALLTVMASPAAAAQGGGEFVSIAWITGGSILAFVALAAMAFGIMVLMRRMREAANEARRLTALLDVLDEGV